MAAAVDTVGVLPVFLTGALAVQLREHLGLRVDSLGVVYASYFVAAASLSAPMGRWAERVGPELALRAGTLLYVAALLGAAGLTSSQLHLLGFVLLSGLGTSITRNATSVLVARSVRPDRQGLAFAIKHCSIPVGSLLAGLSVPALALPLGWRWAYGAAALMSFLVLWSVPRSQARPRPQPVGGEADLPFRVLVVAAVSFALGSSAAASLGAYTVSTAVAAGMDEGTAGVLVAVGSVVGLASRLLVGHWSDRRPGSQLDLVSWMLAVGGLGFLLLGWAREPLLWVAVPLAFATGWAWLGSYNLAMVRLNPVAPGAAVGVTQTGAFVGAIAGPATLGFLAHRYSFAVSWGAAAAMSLLAAAIITALRWVALREGRGPRASRTTSRVERERGDDDESAAGTVPGQAGTG